MPYRNYIYEYHAKITGGEIVAGKWIKAIYKIIVDGLEKQEYFLNWTSSILLYEYHHSFEERKRPATARTVPVKEAHVIGSFSTITEVTTVITGTM